MTRRVLTLLAAILLGAAPENAAAQSAAGDTLEVCVVRDRQVRLETATVDPATRDTVPAGGPSAGVYPPAPLPQADSAQWFARWPTFISQGYRYARYGLLLAFPPGELTRVGEHDGIPLYAMGSPADHSILFVPIAPGCEYQGYYYFHNPGPVRKDGDPTEAPRGRGIEDGADGMLTNEADRTTLRLDGFRRHFIPRYERRHGKLPDSIDDFMPPPGSEMVDYRVDGWGRAFRYRKLGKDYDMRSAGPDGRFDTADDLHVTRSRGIDCQSPLQMSDICES